MTKQPHDSELERSLRAYYHSTLDGARPSRELVQTVLERAHEQRTVPYLKPGLAFALAGVSFFFILASSRALEVLLQL
jgi:hypothetical protein